MSIIGVKVLLGTLFFAFSCIAFLSMLHLLGAPHTGHAKALRIVHRSIGAAAVTFYVIISIICIALPLRRGGELSPIAVIHLTFAALFAPFILLKIIIIEKYPELRNRLFALGSMLFAIAFVIFFTSSAVNLIQARAGPSAESVPEAEHHLLVEKEIFVVRCSKCHRLDRPLSTRKTPEEWAETVHRMRQKDPAWISVVEAEKIARFLASLGS